MAHLRPARSWEGWGTNNPVAPFLSTHSNITERLCVDTVMENARLKTFFLERESERHLRTTSLSASFKSKHPKGCSRECVSTLFRCAIISFSFKLSLINWYFFGFSAYTVSKVIQSYSLNSLYSLYSLYSVYCLFRLHRLHSLPSLHTLHSLHSLNIFFKFYKFY